MINSITLFFIKIISFLRRACCAVFALFKIVYAKINVSFPGAVVLRVAKSWFRIGSLEILTHSGELDLLRLENHFCFFF